VEAARVRPARTVRLLRRPPTVDAQPRARRLSSAPAQAELSQTIRWSFRTASRRQRFRLPRAARVSRFRLAPIRLPRPSPFCSRLPQGASTRVARSRSPPRCRHVSTQWASWPEACSSRRQAAVPRARLRLSLHRPQRHRRRPAITAPAKATTTTEAAPRQGVPRRGQVGVLGTTITTTLDRATATATKALLSRRHGRDARAVGRHSVWELALPGRHRRLRPYQVAGARRGRSRRSTRRCTESRPPRSRW
jgi:hypothetical protein